MSRQNLTVHEALELLDQLNVDDCSDLDPDWSSDEEASGHSKNPYIVMLPPDEKADAVTDEDSDHEETGDPDRLPRRLLNAPAELSRSKLGRLKTQQKSKAAASPARAEGTEHESTDSEVDDLPKTTCIKIKNSLRRSTRTPKPAISSQITECVQAPAPIICPDTMEIAVNNSTPKTSMTPKTELRKKRRLAPSTEETPRQRSKNVQSKIGSNIGKQKKSAKKTNKLQDDEKPFDHSKFECKETIISKIPDINVNASPRSKSCLCENPLRSCPSLIPPDEEELPADQNTFHIPNALPAPSPRTDAACDFSDPMECFRYIYLYNLQFIVFFIVLDLISFIPIVFRIV